jgi:predicted site-specific integrase-resolvase
MEKDRVKMLAALPEVLNTSQVCAALGVNRNTVQAWAKNGKLETLDPRIAARERQRLRFSREYILSLIPDKEREEVAELLRESGDTTT